MINQFKDLRVLESEKTFAVWVLHSRRCPKISSFFEMNIHSLLDIQMEAEDQADNRSDITSSLPLNLRFINKPITPVLLFEEWNPLHDLSKSHLCIDASIGVTPRDVICVTKIEHGQASIKLEGKEQDVLFLRDILFDVEERYKGYLIFIGSVGWGMEDRSIAKLEPREIPSRYVTWSRGPS